jgi:hypothetical protein
MGQYISIIVALLLALLGALYKKGVEEDDQKRPIYDRGWIPRLTWQGKLIVFCLLVSFSVSLWTTWQSSRESRENQKQLHQTLAEHKQKLDQALREQEDLQNQLQIARKETIQGYENVLQEEQRAQEKNLSKFESVLQTQEQAGRRIGEALERSAESLRQATLARLTPVRALKLELFFSDFAVDFVSPTQRLSSRDEGLEAFLCSIPTGASRTFLEMPLAESQNLVFVVIVDKFEGGRCTLHRSLRAFRNGKMSEREILTGDESARNRSLKRLAYWTYIDQDYFESLDLFPTLTLDSFAVTKARATFRGFWHQPQDSKQSVESLGAVMPKTIGLNLVPDLARTELHAASTFTLDPVPKVEGTMWVFYFNPSGTTAKWDLREFLSLPR